MKKQVKIQDVKHKKSFFITHSMGDTTEYVKYSALHRDCYARINGAYFGMGINGINKDFICVFEKDVLVEIEVPGIKFKDIKIGESFICNGIQYEKLFLDSNSYLGRKDKYLYKFDPEQEVEKV